MEMNSADSKDTRTITIPVKTLEFLRYLAKQNITLPAALVHYFKWNRYSVKEIKNHLDSLCDATDEAKGS